GGERYDVTRLVPPDILRIAERAASCFRSAGHAGVDVLVQRLDQPIGGQRCIICEVNCNNDMPMHEFPLFGSPLPMARRELESYLGRRRWAPLRRLARSLSPARGRTPRTRWDVDYGDRKSTRLNSSHVKISYAVFCLKKKKKK